MQYRKRSENMRRKPRTQRAEANCDDRPVIEKTKKVTPTKRSAGEADQSAEVTGGLCVSVDDGDHGNRDQQPGAIDADPCHETWCLHTEKILAKHLVHHRGIVGAKKQHVNHDGVRELRS